MNPIFLALSLLSPLPAAAPAQAVIAPAAIVRPADPAADAIAAYDAARATLIALRDQLLAEAAAKLTQAAEITKRLGEAPKPVDPVDPVRPTDPKIAAVRDMILAAVPAYPERAAKAQAVAAVYRDVAGKVSQAAALNPPPPELRDYTTVAGILGATTAANGRALGADLERWRPLFEGPLLKYLQALRSAGKLGTPGDVAAVWEELARGFEAVR